jgi:hypothetical protein
LPSVGPTTLGFASIVDALDHSHLFDDASPRAAQAVFVFNLTKRGVRAMTEIGAP